MTMSAHVHVWALDDQGFGSCQGCAQTRQFQNGWLGFNDSPYRWGQQPIGNTAPFLHRGLFADREEEA